MKFFRNSLATANMRSVTTNIFVETEPKIIEYEARKIQITQITQVYGIFLLNFAFLSGGFVVKGSLNNKTSLCSDTLH